MDQKVDRLPEPVPQGSILSCYCCGYSSVNDGEDDNTTAANDDDEYDSVYHNNNNNDRFA